ncbi:DUF833-domain-containing protein [Lactifluus subvellereus]|nr:DUF833-domain-containing protein [Lactifluus subvellereus]
MCVGFWSLTHPEYALILCANRDEYLARPTLPAHFHSFEALPKSALNDDGPASQEDNDRGSVLSGRDQLAGGTWLGISRPTGRVALLTNITEPLAAYTSSRGTLVASFLGDPRGNSDLASASSALTSQNASYAGFNLLLLQPLQLPFADELAYGVRLVTNAGGGGRIRARALSDAECACGGISNGVDGEGGESWPKVVQGRAALQGVLDGLSPGIEDSSLAGRLIELLTAHSPIPPPRERAELKNTILVPPLDISAPPDVPPQAGIYATRLAQVILVRRDGRVTYVECDVWVLDSAGAPVRASAADMKSFTFSVGPDL